LAEPVVLISSISFNQKLPYQCRHFDGGGRFYASLLSVLLFLLPLLEL
jgi:hypothetical protein